MKKTNFEKTSGCQNLAGKANVNVDVHVTTSLKNVSRYRQTSIVRELAR